MTDALIIGGGPSIESNLKDLHRLGKFPGVVICTDTSVARMLENKFIDFYAVTLEDTPDLDKYYKPDVVMKEGHRILGGLVADRVHNNTKAAMVKADIKPVNVPECRGYITSNVGLYCWLVAIHKFKCDRTFLVGMDHCYATGKRPRIDKNSSDPAERELYQYAVQELINPYDKETLLLTPEYTLWHEEFRWYATKFPKIEIYNLSGRGALYEKIFKWNPIKEMKSWNDITIYEKFYT